MLTPFRVIISPEYHILSSNLQPSRGSTVSSHYLVGSAQIAHYVVLPTKKDTLKKIHKASFYAADNILVGKKKIMKQSLMARDLSQTHRVSQSLA